MDITSETIWHDGEFVDYDDAQSHLLTHTLHYGLGAFEGIRCYERADGESAIFRLTAHIERLFDTCKIAGIELDWEQETLEEACIETVERNGFKSCYVRPLVYLGSEEMGLGSTANPVHTAIITWEWGALLGDEAIEEGIHAKVSSFDRQSVNASMTKAKIIGQYTNSILANREVKKAGYDEAIMLDSEGYVSEGTGMNLFMVRDGTLFTTPAGGSILEGITRDSVLELADDFGYPVREERFTRDMLYTADEAFLTGTAAEVTPIRMIDDRDIGEGTRGPITENLQSAFFDIVRGSSERHPEWLTYVDV